MKNTKSTFVPILTTNAGRSLTTQNWQDVGVRIAAYDLASLLMKPGAEWLNTISSFCAYVHWDDVVVLNAAHMSIDREGGHTLRSEYDGSRRRYMLEELMALITHIKPQMVLLPEGIGHAWHSLPKNTLPWFTPTALPNDADRPVGVYFRHEAGDDFALLLKHIQPYDNLQRAVTGDVSLPMMRALANRGVDYIVSDTPSCDAIHGLIYTQEGVLSIKDDAMRLDCNVMDNRCNCPTCAQGLTRAYLHHLFEHTPLLCQRFLIQHNWKGMSQPLTLKSDYLDNQT